jgi:hypothetical protein
MSPEQLIGHDFWRLFPFLAAASVGRAMRHAMSARRAVVLAFPSFFRDGQYCVMTALPDPAGGLQVMLRYIQRSAKPALRAATRCVILAALPFVC